MAPPKTTASMNENESLRRVVLRASNSIPFGVRLWCCFKKFVLENSSVRASFETLLTELQFRKKMRPICRKYGPVELRDGSATAKRIERDSLSCLWKYYLSLLHPSSALKVIGSSDSDRGLELHVKEPLDATANLPKELFGLVANLAEADFEALQSTISKSL